MKQNTGAVALDIQENADGLLFRQYQDIPQQFLDELKEYRIGSSAQRCGELQRVASIPAIFVTKWLKEGFNIWMEDEKAIVRKLKQDGLEAFLATEKAV